MLGRLFIASERSCVVPSRLRLALFSFGLLSLTSFLLADPIGTFLRGLRTPLNASFAPSMPPSAWVGLAGLASLAAAVLLASLCREARSPARPQALRVRNGHPALSRSGVHHGYSSSRGAIGR
jgi:hypothetical protein